MWLENRRRNIPSLLAGARRVFSTRPCRCGTDLGGGADSQCRALLRQRCAGEGRVLLGCERPVWCRGATWRNFGPINVLLMESYVEYATREEARWSFGSGGGSNSPPTARSARPAPACAFPPLVPHVVCACCCVCVRRRSAGLACPGAGRPIFTGAARGLYWRKNTTRPKVPGG